MWGLTSHCTVHIHQYTWLHFIGCMAQYPYGTNTNLYQEANLKKGLQIQSCIMAL